MPRIIQLGTAQPKQYAPATLGNDLVLLEVQPEFPTFTDIHVSGDSSLMQAVAECKDIWDIHTHETTPLWIGYNAEAALLATVLNVEYGGAIELREILL